MRATTLRLLIHQFEYEHFFWRSYSDFRKYLKKQFKMGTIEEMDRVVADLSDEELDIRRENNKILINKG